MKSQLEVDVSGAAPLHLLPGRAARLGDRAGELTVLSGRVWLTRDGDPGDHILGPGARVRVAWADRAVLESWERDLAASVQWRPVERRVTLQRFVAAGLRAVAFFAAGLAGGLARAEAGLAALARSAASSANRAQGCISAGDSIASSGALK
jgi:Protein of unknown function (DUF2917)